MAAEVVSLEASLTNHWQTASESAKLLQEEAAKNLARISLIYSGQLYFDFEDTFNPNEPEAA